MEKFTQEELEEAEKFRSSSPETIIRLLSDRKERNNIVSGLQEILDIYAPLHGDDARKIEGIDIAGNTIALKHRWGGDLVSCIPFGKHNYDLEARAKKAREEGHEEVAKKIEQHRNRLGLLMLDVAGHDIWDSTLAFGIYTSFKLGIDLSLEIHGEVTASLFERLNNIFYPGKASHKTVPALYLEVTRQEDGLAGKFIAAGHPYPFIYRGQSKHFEPNPKKVWEGCEPLGLAVSPHTIDSKVLVKDGDIKKDKYEVIDFYLEPQDVLIVCSDGITDHKEFSEDGQKVKRRYSPQHFESVVRSVMKNGSVSAEWLRNVIMGDALSFAQQIDDMSVVVIQPTSYRSI